MHTPSMPPPDNLSEDKGSGIQSASVDEHFLPPDLLQELISNPEWTPVDERLHGLIMRLPRSASAIERTTILTWMYQNNGVIAFKDLVEMIEADDKRQLKKNLRQVLRNLVDLNLIEVINFPDPDKGVTIEDNDGVVGRQSMLTLCWAGMVWLRRAWLARQAMIGKDNYMHVHQLLTEEEDDGKKNSPAWVENIATRQSSSSQGSSLPAVRTVRSIFEMAQHIDRGSGRRKT